MPCAVNSNKTFALSEKQAKCKKQTTVFFLFFFFFFCPHMAYPEQYGNTNILIYWVPYNAL
jgi:hypothetical protein